MNAVSIFHLKKKYESVEALRGIDLEIPEGEFFGLLGPNGAGKSTLIRSMVGLVRPTSGSLRIFDHDVQTEYRLAKSLIGLSPQEVNIDRFFSIQKTLEYQGGYYGLKRRARQERAQALLNRFGLWEKRRAQFYRLSGGMQKRLLVARAMMNAPRLLILDEPTAGIDVEQRRDLWQFLRDLNRDGTTIILTTHYIDEAEELCERVGIIDRGKIVEMGSPKALIEKYRQPDLEEVFVQLTGHKIVEPEAANS